MNIRMNAFKKLPLLLICISLTAVTAAGQSLPTFADVVKAHKELNALILKKKSNEAAHFYADDFIFTNASGITSLKDFIVPEIDEPGLQWNVYETSSPTVRLIGTTAVLTGILHRHGTRHGRSVNERLAITETWAYAKNRWQLLAVHTTALRNESSPSALSAHEQP
jgi:hypothetical protein